MGGGSRDITMAEGLFATGMSALLVIGVPIALGTLPSFIGDEPELTHLSEGNSTVGISRGTGASDGGDDISIVRAEEATASDEPQEETAPSEKPDAYHYAIETVPVYEPPVHEVIVPVEEIQDAEPEYQGNDYSWVDYSVFASLSTKGKIKLLGAMAQEDQRRSGVLASVTMAQCILESGWMRSALTKEGENYFGIKACDLEDNFANSHWGGEIVEMETSEEYVEGEIEKISAKFRAYSNAWQSMLDHSAYLVNSMNGSQPRYPAIAYERDYRKAVQLIKDGGYATSSTYVDSVCRVIEKYELYNWDFQDGAFPDFAEISLGNSEDE